MFLLGFLQGFCKTSPGNSMRKDLLGVPLICSRNFPGIPSGCSTDCLSIAMSREELCEKSMEELLELGRQELWNKFRRNPGETPGKKISERSLPKFPEGTQDETAKRTPEEHARKIGRNFCGNSVRNSGKISGRCLVKIC